MGSRAAASTLACGFGGPRDACTLTAAVALPRSGGGQTRRLNRALFAGGLPLGSLGGGVQWGSGSALDMPAAGSQLEPIWGFVLSLNSAVAGKFTV